MGSIRHETVTLINTTLCECLKYAYQITNDQQIVGPDWARSKLVRYDIVAKAAPGAAPEEMLRMLQALLTERFRLELRHEQRRMSYLAVVAARGGPRLLPASERPARYGRGVISQPRLSMFAFATLLSRQLGQPVLDETGLRGLYDIRLEWTPEPERPAAPDAPASEALAGSSIYSAITEQLGLKLEGRKGPVDTLVIVHAEKMPADN